MESEKEPDPTIPDNLAKEILTVGQTIEHVRNAIREDS